MAPRHNHLSSQQMQEIHAHRVKLLYTGTPVAAAASFINIALLAFLHHTIVASETLVLWGGTVFVLTAIRYGAYVTFFRVNPSPENIGPWERGMVVCMFALGTLWGTSAWIMMPMYPMANQVYTVAAMLGIVAGAMSGLYPVMRVFVAFILPATFQPIARLLWIGDDPQLVLAAMSVLLVIYMIVFGRRHARILMDSLTLRYEKEDLVEKLTREVESSGKLNRELEQIKSELEAIVLERTNDLQNEVNEHKSTARDLLRAKELSDIANRAKTELLANMSHELRTPLNAIMGFTGSIKAEIFGPLGNDKYQEYIDDIASSGQHLLELINDILDVSAIETEGLELQEENIVVDDLVEAAIRLVKDRARQKKIHLRTDVKSDIPMLYADERRIKQILLNLLSNAVKFTLEGGKITLSVSQSSDGGHIFSVVDTGIGMTDIEKVHAMTEFGQVESVISRKEQGAGLGLPLTKGLVKMHGGTIDLRSEKEVGTMVTVTLPKERVVRDA